MKLSEIKDKKSLLIVKVDGDLLKRRKLYDMGFTPGVKLSIIKVAPFGDPIQVFIRSYSVMLRRSDASFVTVVYA